MNHISDTNVVNKEFFVHTSLKVITFVKTNKNTLVSQSYSDYFVSES